MSIALVPTHRVKSGQSPNAPKTNALLWRTINPHTEITKSQKTKRTVEVYKIYEMAIKRYGDNKRYRVRVQPPTSSIVRTTT
jgi:hypothetical protein